MTTPALNVTEQIAIAGQASRAREARDQKTFVYSLFKELETIKAEQQALKELLLEVKELLIQKSPKLMATPQVSKEIPTKPAKAVDKEY